MKLQISLELLIGLTLSMMLLLWTLSIVANIGRGSAFHTSLAAQGCESVSYAASLAKLCSNCAQTSQVDLKC